MTRSLHRVYAIALRYLYLMRGSFSRVLPLFIWVAIDMVLWGFLTRYLQSMMVQGQDKIMVLLGAVLLWDFFIRVMQGVTMTFFEDVWSRNFLNVFASPITVGEYLLGLILCSVLTSLVGLLVMWLVASLVFGMTMAIYGSMVLPFLLILFVFAISLGILSCGMVLRWGPAAEWFIWPIPALLSPFVGVFYPLSILPRWMQHVGACLPPSYVFENLRQISLTGSFSTGSLLIGAALAALLLGVSYRAFVSIYKEATRLGLIARYSAETVG